MNNGALPYPGSAIENERAVRENLGTDIIYFRFPAKEQEMAMQALERVGIADQAHKRADELSGGQQQRVGIARALMQQPRIILADEPVASLDPVLAHSILGHLEDLNRDEGISIICSLHYLDLVQQYAERVIGLRDGQIVYRAAARTSAA